MLFSHDKIITLANHRGDFIEQVNVDMSKAQVTETHKYAIKYYRECIEAILRAREKGRRKIRGENRCPCKRRKKKKKTGEGGTAEVTKERRRS